MTETASTHKHQANRNRIFKRILTAKKTSRQVLAAELDLSMPTINQHIQKLLNDGLIREDGVIATPGAGRKAAAITLNSDARISLGMDITQHHLTIAAVNLNGDVLDRVHMRCTFTNTSEAYQGLNDCIERIIAKNGWKPEQILDMGISLPAIIEEDGRAIDRHALMLIDGAYDFYDQFARYCSIPFHLVNDANAGGFAEIYHRDNISRMIYLSLKHSIGGAVIENNGIVAGSNCRCGEFGHMTLVPNGIPCHCGNLGCANCYCSPDLLAAYTDDNLDLFFSDVKKGNAKLNDALNEYLEYLSILIHNIQLCFDCDIIIGGDISVYLNQYIDTLREKVCKKTHYDIDGGKNISCGSFQSDASAVGAALFQIHDFINNV